VGSSAHALVVAILVIVALLGVLRQRDAHLGRHPARTLHGIQEGLRGTLPAQTLQFPVRLPTIV
jgi:hypothetical protein